LNKEKIKEILQNKKLLGGIAAGILVLAFLIWLIIHFSYSGKGRSSPLYAIPKDAALILEIKQPKDLWNDLSVNSSVWHELENIKPFIGINKDIRFLDSLFKGNDNASSIINDHPIYISFHALSQNSFGYLYLTELTDKCDKPAIDELVKKAAGVKAVITSHVFMGTSVTDADLPGERETFSYTISHNVFICSFQKTLLESAIKQQQLGTSIYDDAGFSKISETTGKNVEADVYINYKYIPQFISILALNDYRKIIAGLSDFACWSAFDVSINKDAVLLNGFTNTNDSLTDFLSTFNKQIPHEVNMLKVIPSNTMSFLCYDLSDFDTWYKSYLTYLKKIGKLNVRNSLIAKLNSTNKTDIEKSFNTWIGKEMALVITEPSDSDISSNMFAVIKANNIDNAKILLGGTPALQSENVSSKSNTKPKKDKKNKIIQHILKRTVTVQTEIEVGDYKIYEYKVPSALPVLFGKLFDSVDGKYYTIVNDFVIFGNTINAMKSFLTDYCDGKNLANNNAYISFSKNIQTESNVYLYCNIKKSVALYNKYASKEIASYIEKNFSLLKNLDAFACQFKSGGKLFYSNICLTAINTSIDESNALWSVKLDTTVLFKPQLINSISGKTKNVLVFDNGSNMYLIDAGGKTLWKLQLNGKPLGEVNVIDYYNNGKSEIMFNTPSSIYLIDGNGKNVENFPLKLNETSTAPMTVADYANNKEYRLIVPCGNKIYNFLKNGSVNKGWTVATTKSEIHKKVSYLKFNGGDYFATSDKDGNVLIIDRKGIERIKLKTSFEAAANSEFYSIKSEKKSKSFILTTDKDGELIFIYSSGEIEKKIAGKFSPKHYFLLNDPDKDKANEYIFLNDTKFCIFDENLKQLCSYSFPAEIDESPVIYTDNSIKDCIGFVSSKTQKVYLLKPDCTLREGFPLTGTTPFVIGSLNNDGLLNLVAGSGCMVYNYSFQ
jgi:hypothetical protein